MPKVVTAQGRRKPTFWGSGRNGVKSRALDSDCGTQDWLGLSERPRRCGLCFLPWKMVVAWGQTCLLGLYVMAKAPRA